MMVIFVFILMHVLCSGSRSSGFLEPVCRGDVLVFECCVTGGDSTVWKGTLFDCPYRSNEIQFPHNEFNSFTIQTAACSNGSVYIVGRSLSVQDNLYTSQLNVTFNYTCSKTGTIECARDNGTIEEIVGHYILRDSDLSCTNCNDNAHGNANSIRTTIVILFTVGILIAVIGIGTVCAWMKMKEKAVNKNPSNIEKHELSKVEACYSTLQRAMSDTKIDHSRNLYPADYDQIATTVYTEGWKQDDDDIIDLDSLLVKLRDNVDSKSWYELGMAIRVPKDILEDLKGYDESQCMIELADYWLRNHPTKPTWSEISDATKHLNTANQHSPDFEDSSPQERVNTAVIPKSLRSDVQRSVSPPQLPSKGVQEYSMDDDPPPRPPKP